MLLAKSNIFILLAFAGLSAASIPTYPPPRHPHAYPGGAPGPPRSLRDIYNRGICPFDLRDLSAISAPQYICGPVVIPFPGPLPPDVKIVKALAQRHGLEYGLTWKFPDFEAYYHRISRDVCMDEQRRQFDEVLLLTVVKAAAGQIIFWFSSIPWERQDPYFGHILWAAENNPRVTELKGARLLATEVIGLSGLSIHWQGVNIPSHKGRCYACGQNLGTCSECDRPETYTLTLT